MRFVFTPDWFTRADVMIELFSFIILAVFFVLAIKSYRLNKNKKSLYLGWGFLFIALAELATILTKVILFYDTTFTQNIGQMVITYHVVRSVDFFYDLGFFINKLFFLVGLYVLYRLPLKKLSISDLILSVFFIIISAFYGQSFYYIFNIVALVFILLIIRNYLEIYRENKAPNTALLISAFTLLGLSEVIFILSRINVLYVLGQLLQLVSYIMLLILIVRILKYGNPKTKSR